MFCDQLPFYVLLKQAPGLVGSKIIREERAFRFYVVGLKIWLLFLWKIDKPANNTPK